MKKIFSMLEQDILNLMHIPSEQLTDLVGYSVQYVSNYFVVNKNIATIHHMSKDKSGDIVPHSLELAKRPKGAVFYINKNDYKDIKNQEGLMDKKKNRPSLGNPAGWNKINKNKDYEVYFHRGHIIACSLGGDKEIKGHDYKALKFSQWHFEDIIKRTVKNYSVCIDSRPIYRNKADVIPIGVHLQAVTKERSLFNVFLPNIDPNIVIDYKKCTFIQVKTG